MKPGLSFDALSRIQPMRILDELASGAIAPSAATIPFSKP